MTAYVDCLKCCNKVGTIFVYMIVIVDKTQCVCFQETKIILGGCNRIRRYSHKIVPQVTFGQLVLVLDFIDFDYA